MMQCTVMGNPLKDHFRIAKSSYYLFENPSTNLPDISKFNLEMVEKVMQEIKNKK
jgi:hypothetical protein